MKEPIEVVVTGMGVVSPIGNNLQEFEKSLFEGRSGAGPVTRFDPASLPTRVGCEVKNFSTDFRDIKIPFALEAASQAMSMAGLDKESLAGKKSRLSIGIGLELFNLQDLIELKNGAEADAVKRNSLHFLNTPSDLCCHLIGLEHGLSMAPLIHISACAAGNDAVGSAFNQISSGAADVVLCGGTDSMINPMGIAGFSRIGAMTLKNETPQKASMPFNKNRDGFVIGEGAGFLVLESRQNAVKRGAKILGSVTGQGNSLDAYSISDPHPQGAGAALAMQRALERAGLSPEDISAVSAHATGTPKNDPAETAAIKTVFAQSWENTPVIATKSLIGHTISAAGAIETIAALLCIQRSRLHQTLNLTEEDTAEDCSLCHVLGQNMNRDLKHILNNSFGFGGQNACLVVSRWENA